VITPPGGTSVVKGGNFCQAEGPLPFDPDKANDKADITLDVTGGAPTPTGSLTSGSGGSAGGSSSTGGVGTTNGGTLAATGSSTLPITGVGGPSTVALSHEGGAELGPDLSGAFGAARSS